MIFRHLLNMQSHPTWVRGLKRNITASAQYVSKSHPTWVRGLKHANGKLVIFKHESHPTWVRGLKHLVELGKQRLVFVAPYVGAWIETFSNLLYASITFVAPYVGAWIETSISIQLIFFELRRTLRGCVD